MQLPRLVVLLVVGIVAVACLLLQDPSKRMSTFEAHIPAYVISVPNTRCRDAILARFEGKVRGVRIYDGVDGTQLQSADRLRPGELGCAKSHMRLWGHVLRTGAPALVFEDDADPVPDFDARLARILPHIDDSIDMVFLGHCAEAAGTPYAPGLINSVHPRCTHGYLVTRRGVRKLVDWAANAVLRSPIDEELARLIHNGQLRAVSCVPPIVGTTTDASLITQMGGRGASQPAA